MTLGFASSTPLAYAFCSSSVFYPFARVFVSWHRQLLHDSTEIEAARQRNQRRNYTTYFISPIELRKAGFFRRLIRLDMIRNEPGTPSGSCRKNANDM